MKIFLGFVGVIMLVAGCYADTLLPETAVVEYKQIGETNLVLHVFNPPGHTVGAKAPAIVFFFGGGWNGGNPSQFFNQSKYFASRGMVGISAEYRTKKGHGTTPMECVKDGKSAIRWVRSHAKELGVDPKKIAAGGGSAGGHVAAATATIEMFNEEGEDDSVSCVPAALVLFNPVFDNGPNGYGYDRVNAYWEDFSPLHNLKENVPPTLVLLGTKDNLIPVATAKHYQQKMESLGARCDLILYEDQKHGFFNVIKYEETLQAADDFLVSQNLLERKRK